MFENFKKINFLFLWKTKIFYYFFPLAFTWLVSCFVFIYASRNSYQLEIDRAKTAADNVNKIIETYFQGVFKSADISVQSIRHAIVNKGVAHKWTIKDYNEVVTPRLAWVPEVFAIRIADKNGNLFDENKKTKGTISIAGRDYFQEHKSNQNSDLIVSKPYIGKIIGRWLITISRRITLKDGTFGGIIQASIETNVLVDFLKNFKLGPNGSISIFTIDHYELIARHPELPELLGKPVKNSSVYAQYRKSKEREGFVQTISALDGVSRMNKYRVDEKLGLFFVASVAEKDFLDSWIIHTLFGGGILGLVGVFLFITFGFFIYVQSQLDESKIRLVKYEKMAALGEMAGGIAHEINNPLSIILGKTELSLKSLKEGRLSQSEMIDCLKKIDSTAQRIVKIVRGLKLFSRDSEGDAPIQFSLKNIVIDTMGVCFEKFKSVGFDVVVSDFVDANVMCRPAQISQVLLNLLNNSFDATEGLPARWVKISSMIKENRIQISVTDSGSGLSEKIADKVMQPFFSTKEVGKGTGLGLSISKGIVEEHQGLLYLDTKNPNTTFIIELPVA